MEANVDITFVTKKILFQVFNYFQFFKHILPYFFAYNLILVMSPNLYTVFIRIAYSLLIMETHVSLLPKFKCG